MGTIHKFHWILTVRSASTSSATTTYTLLKLTHHPPTMSSTIFVHTILLGVLDSEVSAAPMVDCPDGVAKAQARSAHSVKVRLRVEPGVAGRHLMHCC